nr:cyclic phosphodiesterase-like isoform X2 [Nicotiana tomentosiformis]
MLHNIFLIRFLSFLGLIGISLLFYSVLIETDPMQEVQLNEAAEIKKLEVYSVWALPSEDVRERLKKLMGGLRSEFGGPQFEPHVTVVGAIRLTEDEARDKFRKGCEGVKAYNATVEKVDTGTFFYQCVYLLLHPTNEVVEASARCCSNFGYNSSSRKLYVLSFFGSLHLPLLWLQFLSVSASSSYIIRSEDSYPKILII